MTQDLCLLSLPVVSFSSSLSSSEDSGGAHFFLHTFKAMSKKDLLPAAVSAGQHMCSDLTERRGSKTYMCKPKCKTCDLTQGETRVTLISFFSQISSVAFTKASSLPAHFRSVKNCSKVGFCPEGLDIDIKQWTCTQHTILQPTSRSHQPIRPSGFQAQ